MNTILWFLTEHFRPIWADGTYCITDSENSRVNGGNAWLVIASAKVRMRFVVDRGQLMLDIQSPFGPGKRWFGAALFWRVIRKVKPDSELLDANLAELVLAELATIEQMMSSDHWSDTYEDLKRAEAQRSHELWG